MKKLIYLIFLGFIFFNYTEHYYSDCSDCKKEIIIEKELKKETGENFLKIDLESLTIHELEEMVEPKQFEDDEVFLESITSMHNFFFVRNLKNGVTLKIHPLFPSTFQYDYLNKTEEMVIEEARGMKIQCVYLYINRNCIANQLKFKELSKGTYKLLMPTRA